MIRLRPFKKKEGNEGRSQLVTNGRRRKRFQCLEANGRKRRRFIFTSSHFPPNRLYLDLPIFSFDIKVLLYHGYRSLFMHFLPFPWPINYDRAFWCHKSPTYSLLIRFGWISLLFSLKLWRWYDHVLWASSCVNKWRAGSGIIFRFDVDATSSWWRLWTTRSACSSWNQSPSSLVLSHFSKLSHLGDFVASWPRLRWWTWNHLWRLLQDWRYLYLCMVFNFPVLDTVVGCTIRFTNCLPIVKQTT